VARRQPGQRPHIACARLRRTVDQVAGDDDQVGPQRIAALDHFAHPVPVHQAADVQVGQLHHPEPVQGRRQVADRQLDPAYLGHLNRLAHADGRQQCAEGHHGIPQAQRQARIDGAPAPQRPGGQQGQVGQQLQQEHQQEAAVQPAQQDDEDARDLGREHRAEHPALDHVVLADQQQAESQADPGETMQRQGNDQAQYEIQVGEINIGEKHSCNTLVFG